MDFENRREAKRTVEQLRDKFHMNDDRFSRLHHFFYKRPETIKRFVDYCLKGDSFEPGGTNVDTAQRLHLCLERMEAGDSWTIAIQTACAKYPIPR